MDCRGSTPLWCSAAFLRSVPRPRRLISAMRPCCAKNSSGDLKHCWMRFRSVSQQCSWSRVAPLCLAIAPCTSERMSMFRKVLTDSRCDVRLARQAQHSCAMRGFRLCRLIAALVAARAPAIEALPLCLLTAPRARVCSARRACSTVSRSSRNSCMASSTLSRSPSPIARTSVERSLTTSVMARQQHSCTMPEPWCLPMAALMLGSREWRTASSSRLRGGSLTACEMRERCRCASRSIAMSSSRPCWIDSRTYSCWCAPSSCQVLPASAEEPLAPPSAAGLPRGGSRYDRLYH
mmetsp:Transcript_2902/g.6814  ORF Transcript_2902/g.6814 Transcript_2902/m.6814 type:complete len:293 (+) Transcript_2902:531-1409(+)